MKRCTHCLGKFGLVRHYWGFKQFCSKHCLNRHRYEVAQELARARFLAWLRS
jgi:hypothetical protein